MKIAIDISQIVYGTGVSTYTENLVRNLLKIDKENEYLLFAGSLRRKQDILKIFPQTKVFLIPPTLADLIWNRFHKFPIEIPHWEKFCVSMRGLGYVSKNTFIWGVYTGG